MAYYLGLDNGGTSTKAAIFDSRGNEISVATTETRKIIPCPGFTERDMDEMWRANVKVIQEVIAKSGIFPEDIACVACCGHGKGLYLLDEHGRPARNGIISTDNRAWKYPQKWEHQGISDAVFKISCQHVLASQPVSLLAWLKDNEPEVIEKTRWILMCKDYIRYCLTGEARGELTDYSGANFVNLYSGEYDLRLLQMFGIPECESKLPPLCRSTEVCGRVTEKAAMETGLKIGTPVAGGAFDIDACALAVNVTDDEHVCMIAGTWSINEYVRREPVMDGKVLMNSLFCTPGRYLIEESSPTSAGNNEWFIQTLLPELEQQKLHSGESIYKQMNEWVASIPDTEVCPVFLPFLMASNVHPNAKGAFVGLSSFHTRAHMARSIYEGIAFSHKYHMEKLMATRTGFPKSIRLAGGAAKSAVWVQMFADVMNLPIEVVDVHETGALGCAIICAVAAGEYRDVEQAASHMCNIAEPVFPNPQNILVYEKKYDMYISVIRALDSVWDKLEKLQTNL